MNNILIREKEEKYNIVMFLQNTNNCIEKERKTIKET